MRHVPANNLMCHLDFSVELRTIQRKLFGLGDKPPREVERLLDHKVLWAMLRILTFVLRVMGSK